MDAVDKDMFKTVCSKVVSAVADGGPSEQRALFELSPSATKLGCNEALFPKLVLISRDRSHRRRSVVKGAWEQAGIARGVCSFGPFGQSKPL